MVKAHGLRDFSCIPLKALISGLKGCADSIRRGSRVLGAYLDVPGGTQAALLMVFAICHIAGNAIYGVFAATHGVGVHCYHSFRLLSRNLLSEIRRCEKPGLMAEL